jgi:hypothetical protein
MSKTRQSVLFVVLWFGFWLAGTIAGAVLQAWLIDAGLLSALGPPWIISIGSIVVGFFGGALLSAAIVGFFRKPQSS